MNSVWQAKMKNEARVRKAGNKGRDLLSVSHFFRTRVLTDETKTMSPPYIRFIHSNYQAKSAKNKPTHFRGSITSVNDFFLMEK